MARLAVEGCGGLWRRGIYQMWSAHSGALPLFFLPQAARPSNSFRPPANSVANRWLFRAQECARHTGKKGPLWPDESFDHVLRSDESFAEKIEYIRQNPRPKRLGPGPRKTMLGLGRNRSWHPADGLTDQKSCNCGLARVIE